MKPVSKSFETGFIAFRKYLRWPTQLLASAYGYMVNEKRGILRDAPFFFQLSLPSPAHFVIFSPFLAVSQYFVVPLHKNNNKLQENGKDYIDGRPSYR